MTTKGWSGSTPTFSGTYGSSQCFRCRSCKSSSHVHKCCLTQQICVHFWVVHILSGSECSSFLLLHQFSAVLRLKCCLPALNDVLYCCQVGLLRRVLQPLCVVSLLNSSPLLKGCFHSESRGLITWLQNSPKRKSR